MNAGEKPWVSFCMSTYKRPELLSEALSTISKQTFTAFEVIISDNDPEKSAKGIVEDINDLRFKYFSNCKNLGMIQSFNLSIERASADYIVMITDDDPVEEKFLSELYEIYKQNNNYGIYAGFLRTKTIINEIEYIKKEIFAEEILDINKTKKILWSSCIIKKKIAIQIGKIPEYGSPHLSDHALIAMAGSINGGIIINKMYSTLSSHNSNFSKSNLESYKTGCIGFHETLTAFFKNHSRFQYINKAIDSHLKSWFITIIFVLKKHYTVVNKKKNVLNEINGFAKSILQLNFMRRYKLNYFFKNFIFFIKRTLGLL